MKSIQLAMVVLLSHSLCVQAVIQQQTLDTELAWHVRNQMESKIEQKLKIQDLSSIHERVLLNTIMPDKINRANRSDSIPNIFDVINSKESTKAYSQDLNSSINSPILTMPVPLNINLKRLIEISPVNAQLSEVNWDEITDDFSQKIRRKDRLDHISEKLSSMNMETEKVRNMVTQDEMHTYLDQRVKNELKKETDRYYNSRYADLKKKFNKINDNRYMKMDGESRRSMNKSSERIRIGCSIQAHRSNPAFFGFSPEVEYNPSLPFSLGAGLVYNLSAKFDDSEIEIHKMGPGFRIYTDIDVRKLFLRGEYQSGISFLTDELKGKYDSRSMCIGGGRKIQLSKGLIGEPVLLYRIFEERDEQMISPWTLHFGLKRTLIN